MPTVQSFRVVPLNRAFDPFNGEGASKYGGRWNSRGTPVIYTSSSRSLAILEILANLNGPVLKRDYSIYTVDIPEEECMFIEPKSLPKKWNDPVDKDITKLIGTEWAKTNASVALKVPSVLIDAEFNYILNPKHKNFKKVIKLPKSDDYQHYEIDPRLIRV